MQQILAITTYYHYLLSLPTITTYLKHRLSIEIEGLYRIAIMIGKGLSLVITTTIDITTAITIDIIDKYITITVVAICSSHL